MKYYDLEDFELVKKINTFYKNSRDYSKYWRKENRDLHDFRSGHQWSEDDKAVLEEQNRPPVVFNRAGTIIDAVVGNEISNRQDIRFLPRTNDDSAFSEMATEVIRWIRNECNAEDEESDSFEDVLIGGMGWVETKIDYDENGELIIVMNAVDPAEMYWDPDSRKHNLEDRTWQIREKWVPIEEAKETWPEIADLKPTEGMAPELDEDVRNADPPYYERESTGFDKKRNQVRILEFQWVERETVFVVQNPVTNQVETVKADSFKKLSKRFPEMQYSRTKKPHCYRAFVIGETLLEKGDAPDKCKFNYQCITGKRDSKEGGFFGLMRGIKDPQEWANKFFSQILHIINSNSKGGFFFETGALKDPKKAEQDMARPEGMVELNPGGMGRIKERQMFQFPASIDRMLEFAISSIRDVPGVNLELLGAANREQAGVLESQRSKQALTVLAPIFSNLRRYRKNQGKTLLYFVREYIPSGRLIRVVGEEGAKVIPLMKDSLAAEYDIIVEQSPHSPNVKTEAWVAIRDVLPILQAAGMQPPKEIIDVLPLPDAMTAKWKETIRKGPPPEVMQKMQEMDQTIQELQQENQQLQSKQQIKAAEMQINQQNQQQNLQLQAQRLQEEMQMRGQQMQQDFALKSEEIRQNLELEQQKMIQEIQMNREKIQAEYSLKMECAAADHSIKQQDMQMKMDMDENKNVHENREEIKTEISNIVADTAKMNEEIIASLINSSNKQMTELANSIRGGIESALSKPKALIFDKNGEITGSKPVERLN